MTVVTSYTERVHMVEAFLSEYGSLVRTALEVYAREMRETSEATATAAQQPAITPAETACAPLHGTINITPTPQGFRRMSQMFADSAARADEAMAKLEELEETIGA